MTQTRDEIMTPFRMLTRHSLRHESGAIFSLDQKRGRNREKEAEQHAAAEALLAHLKSTMPDGWSMMSHGGAPVQMPLAEPDGQTAETYHARSAACADLLEAQGIKGAGQVLNMPAGWLTVIEEASKGLAARKAIETDPETSLNIQQVKEKFGTMRFYIYATGSDEFVRDAFDIAEWAEAATEERCVVTGKPGTLDHAGWVLTLSDEMKTLRHENYKGFSDLIYPPMPKAQEPESEPSA